MKVMILAGGMGTRLREHTEVRPKPMVEIGGRPILWHIMKLYAHHGFNDFIICLGYKANVIKEYFLNYEAMNCDFTIGLGNQNSIEFHGNGHTECGWKITLAYTGENAMTGSRIKQASRYLGSPPETFCVTYGDGVTDADLTKALAFHKAHGKLATLTGVKPPSRWGELEVKGVEVVAFGEKPQISGGIVNGGFFFFEPGFLEYVSEDPICTLEREPLERLAADGQLQVYEHSGYWQCMDTFRDWENLERQWQTGKAKWKVWA